MSALAVIERELRVSSRRRFTWVLRVLIASLAALAALSAILWAGQTPGPMARATGKMLLQTLAWFGLAICLIEGVRQTYDSISAEKRDGTLGLLLLTRLRGSEVVVGKLAAASVGVCFALVAAFPAMALAFPSGGVTAGEFWRAQLVLVNTLFLSMACGIFASAGSRESAASLFRAIGLLTAICVLPPALQIFSGNLIQIALSPATALHLSESGAYLFNAAQFWTTLAAMHLVGWVLIGLAGFRITGLTDDWEKADPAFPSRPEHVAGWKYRPAPSLRARQRRVLDKADPVVWIASRTSRNRRLIWAAVLLMVLLDSHFLLLVLRTGLAVGYLFAIISALGAFLPALLLALAASAGVTEARRSRALELMLCTPLSGHEIARGYSQVLWNRLKVPLLVLAAAVLFRSIGLPILMTATKSPLFSLYVALHLMQTLKLLLLVLAVCWVAMWLGIRVKKPSHAIGLTLFLTLVAPWIFHTVFQLVAGLYLRPSSVPSPSSFQWILKVSGFGTGLVCLYLLLLIRWARHGLFNNFRRMVAE